MKFFIREGAVAELFGMLIKQPLEESSKVLLWYENCGTVKISRGLFCHFPAINCFKIIFIFFGRFVTVEFDFGIAVDKKNMCGFWQKIS